MKDGTCTRVAVHHRDKVIISLEVAGSLYHDLLGNLFASLVHPNTAQVDRILAESLSCRTDQKKEQHILFCLRCGPELELDELCTQPVYI